MRQVQIHCFDKEFKFLGDVQGDFFTGDIRQILWTDQYKNAYYYTIRVNEKPPIAKILEAAEETAED